MISGILTALLLAVFVGISLWAWSARSRVRFAEAEQLPLRDETLPPVPSPANAGRSGTGQCCGRAGDEP